MSDCSEFMSEYKTSLFWEFVNQTKSLRPASSSDKGKQLFQVIDLVILFRDWTGHYFYVSSEIGC